MSSVSVVTCLNKKGNTDHYYQFTQAKDLEDFYKSVDFTKVKTKVSSSAVTIIIDQKIKIDGLLKPHQTTFVTESTQSNYTEYTIKYPLEKDQIPRNMSDNFFKLRFVIDASYNFDDAVKF